MTGFARPRFRPNLVVSVLDPDQVFLVSESRQFILMGRGYRAVAPYLDGRRTTDEVLAAATTHAALPEAMFALHELGRKGYVVEGDGVGVDDATAAWWDALGAPPVAAAARLATASVAIETVGPVRDVAVRAALGARGIAVAPADDGVAATHHVVLTDDYLREGLAATNDRRRAAGVPWLLAKPFGAVAWVGPAFTPGDGPCWACLAQRVRGNRQLEAFVERKGLGREPGPVVTTRATADGPARLGAELVATVVEQWIVTGAPPVAARATLRTHDLLAGSVTQHAVVHRPQCPACGDPGLSDPARTPPPVVLRPNPKRHTSDGGHRIADPHATYERLKHHVSPVTGAISVLEKLGHEATGLTYAYMAGHNFALITDDLFFLRSNIRGRSGGKGMTDIQAKVSAMCEAIERYSGVWRGDEPARRAAYADVADRAVPLDELLNFSPRQYADRDAWNARQPDTRQHLVPARLPDDHVIEWAPAWSLSHERERLVPSAYVWYGHDDLRTLFFCCSDANGCAAGNTLEEATLQALMEVVERDGTAIWWYNRLRRPAVDLPSFREPYLDRLREHYRTLGREFWVLDLTTDVGIPVFTAVSRRVDRPVEDIVLGLGAHLDPRTALLRAVTEMNQFLPAVIKEKPDGTTDYWFPDTEAHRWWRTATIATDPWVTPDPARPARRLADFTPLSTDDVTGDVRHTVARLAALGMETLVVDQSRPDIELAVAKVMVPGMRHFWRRLGPGRLYDEPVRSGVLAAPVAEAAMNPWSIFF